MDASAGNTLLDVVFQELTEAELQEIFKPFDSPKKRDIQNVDVDRFIEDQKKKTTKSSTDRDIKNVQRWLYDNKKEPRVIENIPPHYLNDLLAELFISIRKTNGSNNEPSSLECLKNSIKRYLREKNYQCSLKDKVFQKSMSVLSSKKVELKKQGLGRKPNKSIHITPDEECKMYECGALGDNNPKSLITTLFLD